MQYKIPGRKPPSDELTSEQEQVKVDIVDKIRGVVARFPRLNFLENVFDDYFEQIEDTLKLVVWEPENVTVGRYMKNLA